MVMQPLTGASKGFGCVKHALHMLLFPFKLSHLLQHHSDSRLIRRAGNAGPAPQSWARGMSETIPRFGQDRFSPALHRWTQLCGSS